MENNLDKIIEKVENIEKKLLEVPQERNLPIEVKSIEDEKANAYRVFAKSLSTVIASKNPAMEIETKGMTEGSATVGGAFVPTLVSNEIHTAFEKNGLITSLCRKVTIDSKSIDWPIHTTNGTVFAPGEAVQITDSSASSTKVTFTPVGLKSIHLFSSELEEDSLVPIVPYINEVMGEEFTAYLDKAALSGVTTSFSSGLMKNANISSVSAAAGGSASATLSTTTLSADDIANMLTKLQSNNTTYANGSVFVMNPNALGVVRKLKDTTNQYIFTNSNFGIPNAGINSLNGYPIEGYLFGKPVFISQQLPDATTSATGAGRNLGIILGNFKHMLIVERRGLTVAYTNEGSAGGVNTFDTDQTAIKFTQRVDVKPLKEDAFVKLVASA